MINDFNNKEIKAIFDLRVYGLSINEIRNVFLGKTIYEIIQERVIILVESVQEHNENLGVELENIDIVKLLEDPEKRKELIDKLDYIKEKVNQDEKDRIDNIVLLINNVDKIQNDCIKNIIVRDKIEINNSVMIGKIKEESPCIISKEFKNIISEEEWERLQQIMTDN